MKKYLSHGLLLLAIPTVVALGATVFRDKQYAFISLAVAVLACVAFFLCFERNQTSSAKLVLIAVLTALSVVGRLLFGALPGFKPVTAMVVLTAMYFGSEAGFLTGALTAVLSNFYFGQGPWTPFQMFSMGIIGFLAGVLFRKGWLRRSRGALAMFGGIVTFVIYGAIMNPVSALIYGAEMNWQTLLTYYITGFPMDCVHACATVIFLLLLAEPMLEKLDRIKVKYGLVE